MEVSAGRAIVDVLRAEGVKAVFGIPGGHTLGIYDALYDTPESAISWCGTSRSPATWRQGTRSSPGSPASVA